MQTHTRDLARVGVFSWRASWQLSAMSKFTWHHGLASPVALPHSCRPRPELTSSAKHSWDTSPTAPGEQGTRISQAWLDKLPVESCMAAIEQVSPKSTEGTLFPRGIQPSLSQAARCVLRAGGLSTCEATLCVDSYQLQTPHGLHINLQSAQLKGTMPC